MKSTAPPTAPKVAILAIAALGASPSAYIFASQPTFAPPAHLSVKTVLKIANSAITKRAGKYRHLKPRSPEFHSDRASWWVYYYQAGPLYAPDGDMIVVVNDKTALPCVEQAAFALHCT